jgi:hypothetical protein
MGPDSLCNNNLIAMAGPRELVRCGIQINDCPALLQLMEANGVSEYGMRERCIAAAPGVSLAANRIKSNRCGGKRD